MIKRNRVCRRCGTYYQRYSVHGYCNPCQESASHRSESRLSQQGRVLFALLFCTGPISVILLCAFTLATSSNPVERTFAEFVFAVECVVLAFSSIIVSLKNKHIANPDFSIPIALAVIQLTLTWTTAASAIHGLVYSAPINALAALAYWSAVKRDDVIGG